LALGAKTGGKIDRGALRDLLLFTKDFPAMFGGSFDGRRVICNYKYFVRVLHATKGAGCIRKHRLREGEPLIGS
jgi:hypothetical protein